MRFSKVRPNQPLCPGEGVVEVLLGGVVLVGWPPVVFSDEPEIKLVHSWSEIRSEELLTPALLV